MTKQNFKIEILTKEYFDSIQFQTEKKYDYARYFVKQSKFFDSLNKENAPIFDVYDQYITSNFANMKNKIAKNQYDKDITAIIQSNLQSVKIKLINGKNSSIVEEQKLPDSLIQFLSIYEGLKALNKQLDKAYNKEILTASIERTLNPTQKNNVEFQPENQNKINLIKVKMKITRNAMQYIKLSGLQKEKLQLVSDWLTQVNLPTDKAKLQQFATQFSTSSQTPLQME